MKKIISLLIPLIFIGVGVIKLIDQVDIYQKLKNKDLWQETTGLITKNEVVNDYANSNLLGKANLLHRSAPFVVEVSYEFLRGFELVKGHRIMDSQMRFDLEQAARIYSEQFHTGKTVTIYYLKENPTFALLDLSLNTNFWKISALYLVLVLVGFASLKGAFS